MSAGLRQYRLAWAGVALAAGLAGGWCPAEEKGVEERVKELLVVLTHPEARRSNLKETVAAQAELTRIGGPAAPQLVEAVVNSPPASNVGSTAGQILLAVGKPALPAIRARWADLNDERRWRLMPVLEKHDPRSVREYAWNCLDAEGAIRLAAWHFVLRTRDARAKDRYFDALTVEGKETPFIRWRLLPGEKPIYDEARENDILIELLAPDSWVAKGEGNPPPPGIPPPWWPDARPDVVLTLHQRKATDAAPALLEILKEKGPGAGYLAEQIIPVLADFKHKETIPELERIAASKPETGQREDLHPHALSGSKAVRQLAADAVKRLNAR